MKNIFLYFFIPAIILLYSCASKQGLVDGKISDYEKTLSKYTRSGKDYKDFETKLIASATYRPLEFVYAQINKIGNDLIYDYQKVNMLKIKAQREDELSVNFFISAYTPDERFLDFSKSKDFWKIYLKKGEFELIEAKRVKPVSKSDLPEYELLYPYISPWMKCYEVSFSRSDISKSTGSSEIKIPITLVIAGQLGRLELDFD